MELQDFLMSNLQRYLFIFELIKVSWKIWIICGFKFLSVCLITTIQMMSVAHAGVREHVQDVRDNIAIFFMSQVTVYLIFSLTYI